MLLLFWEEQHKDGMPGRSGLCYLWPGWAYARAMHLRKSKKQKGARVRDARLWPLLWFGHGFAMELLCVAAQRLG
jgi:hypothetical protein